MTTPEEVERDCPECGGIASHTDAVETLNSLYDHRDDYAQCHDCGHVFAYRGKTLGETDDGIHFYDAEARTFAKRPLCPEHLEKMTPTKIWPSEGRIQVKCEVEREDGERCERLQTVELEEYDG